MRDFCAEYASALGFSTSELERIRQGELITVFKRYGNEYLQCLNVKSGNKNESCSIARSRILYIILYYFQLSIFGVIFPVTYF